jgi:hypothetical protein
MICNRHSLGALILTLGVSLAGLLLAYGATGIVLRHAGERISLPMNTVVSSPEQRWIGSAPARG